MQAKETRLLHKQQQQRQMAKEEYEKYEMEFMKNHNFENTPLNNYVNGKYYINCNLHIGLNSSDRQNHLDIRDTSDFYIACGLAEALYSINDGTDFYKGIMEDLYKVLPKEKVDAYVFGRFENETDTKTMNFLYDELEVVQKYRIGKHKEIIPEIKEEKEIEEDLEK